MMAGAGAILLIAGLVAVCYGFLRRRAPVPARITGAMLAGLGLLLAGVGGLLIAGSFIPMGDAP